jgi:dihydrofolate reductase
MRLQDGYPFLTRLPTSHFERPPRLTPLECPLRWLPMTTTAKVVAVEHLTLDGVYQAPARADEDERGGFKRGGWAVAADDAEMQKVIGRYMATGWSLLVGRTTYEDLYEGWHVRRPSNPITQALATAQKFVVSRNAAYKMAWKNSTLLSGDATEAVLELKNEHDKTLVIFGSGMLVRSLLGGGLVDELLTMIHPLLLGEGRRFFDDVPFTTLTLADTTRTASGVIIATYRAAPASVSTSASGASPGRAAEE